MTLKQTLNSLSAPDGSHYVTLTDGAGNLAPASGGGSSNPNGQATMANSAPVVIASDQSAIPVTVASTTITGTVAATQSGTWTVQPGNTANTTAWKVDGSAVTQPVSAATLPLPTGAATSASQTTMGTNQTVVQAPVAPATATATKANLIAGQYNSAVQAFTNGQQGALQFDQRGGLLIQDGQAIPSVSVTSATTLFTVADTSGYGSISVQVTSAGSATVTYEVSEDGTTWNSVAGTTPNNTGGSSMVTNSVAIGMFQFNLTAKQFRARVSSYSSGTITIQGTLKKDSVGRVSVSIGNNVSVIGTTTEAGVVQNGLQILSEGRTTNKAAVTSGQAVRPIATSIGAAVNKPFQVPELDWSYPAAAGGINNTTTAVTMVGAAGAGIRNYLTAIQVSAGALGAASEIAVRDGAGGTVIWRGFISTAGGNQSVNLSSPIKSTANTLLEVVTLTATITGAVYINAQGYQAP